MAKNTEQPIRCSFCGKREGPAARLIAGPGVCICSDCVQACSDLLREDIELDQADAMVAPEKIPTPVEMSILPSHFAASVWYSANRAVYSSSVKYPLRFSIISTEE